MSATTLSSSHPTVVSKEDIRYPGPEEACFACDPPPYKHLREWKADPNGPERRGRTLVLRFDGTGDSFDEDVSEHHPHFSQVACETERAICRIQMSYNSMKDDPAKQLVYYQVSSLSLPVKSALLMRFR